MTEEELGTITDVEVADGTIEYVAEHPDGRRMRGVLGRRIGPHTYLSDDALEQAAEQILGSKTEWPEV